MSIPVQRLTEQQVRETVARVGYSAHVAEIVIQRYLAGEPAARFVIATHYKRQQSAAKEKTA